MQDRFRFRVWFTPDYQEPEMIYDAEQTYDFGCQGKGSYHHDNFGEILEDKDCIVMQCTGLKDKNGKLIYESDIVKIFHVSGTMQGKSFTDVVEWNELRYRFDTERYGVFDEDDTYEVIGNIYQDSHLIENSNNLC